MLPPRASPLYTSAEKKTCVIPSAARDLHFSSHPRRDGTRLSRSVFRVPDPSILRVGSLTSPFRRTSHRPENPNRRLVRFALRVILSRARSAQGEGPASSSISSGRPSPMPAKIRALRQALTADYFATATEPAPASAACSIATTASAGTIFQFPTASGGIVFVAFTWLIKSSRMSSARSTTGNPL